MANIFDLREKIAQLAGAIAEDSEWIGKNAGDPATKIEDLRAKKEHRDSLVERQTALQSEIDSEEAAQRVALKKQGKASNGVSDPVTDAKTRRGAFYRAVITGTGVQDAYVGLGAVPPGNADLGNGDALLPITVSKEVIVDPVVENPMRRIVKVSNIKGLVEPKLLFTLDTTTYDNVADTETAKEIAASADQIKYGRNQTVVYVTVKDSVMSLTNYDLASDIEDGLRSGLAQNEINRMFAASPSSPYDLMSFYSTANNIKRVSGTSKREAIALAIADLPLAYRQNAKIVISASDYYDLWKENSMINGDFDVSKPVPLFGKEVEIVDSATDPIIGNFAYARINYESARIKRTEGSGENVLDTYFALIAEYDIRIRLSSAFRIATVDVNP
jgi:HK97 family phage major capsid protein